MSALFRPETISPQVVYAFNIRSHQSNQGDNGPKMTEKLKQLQVHSFFAWFRFPQSAEIWNFGWPCVTETVDFCWLIVLSLELLRMPRRLAIHAHNFKLLMKSALRFVVLRCHWHFLELKKADIKPRHYLIKLQQHHPSSFKQLRFLPTLLLHNSSWHVYGISRCAKWDAELMKGMSIQIEKRHWVLRFSSGFHELLNMTIQEGNIFFCNSYRLHGYFFAEINAEFRADSQERSWSLVS